MAFSTDYTDVKESTGGLLPIGEWETIIKYAGEDATKSGTIYINVTLVIRNDIDQAYKNKYIWHKLWHRKEPTQADLACGGYSFKQIQSLSKAAGLPNGKKYDSLSEWCEDLENRPVRITVEHEEYNGKTQERVRWVNATKHPDCKHAWKKNEEDFVPADGAVDVQFTELSDDEELPF